jgi:carotenoid cleavage dioxygenase-like enzyme
MDHSRRNFLKFSALTGAQLSPLSALAFGTSRLGQPRDDVDPASIQIQKPYLYSMYAPTEKESDYFDLPVEGAIPTEISGTYFRNGPNIRHQTHPHHWFDGDGMIHRIEIKDGKAHYRNRFVHTRAYEIESKLGKIFPGLHEALKPESFAGIAATALLLNSPLKDTSNTDLIYFNDQLLSLWWLSGRPYAIDPETLATKGVAQFESYTGNMSAHAKVDPRTGEIFFLNFSQVFPKAKVGAMTSNGQLSWIKKFKLPYPKLYHDLLFTENFVILMDFPVSVQSGIQSDIGLDRRYSTQIILIPRDGKSPHLIYETDPCYVLHGINAFERDHKIFLSVNKFKEPFAPRSKEDEHSIPYIGPLRIQTQPVLWISDWIPD